MRLIDAEPIVRDLTGMKSMFDAISLDGMIKGLNEAPTVDAAPVVHGYWKQTGKHFLPYQCSVCESEEDGRTYYCPNCGAKMDGREDNEA